MSTSSSATVEDAIPGDGDRALTVPVKLGWGFGSAGQVSMLYLANMLLMYFMVAHLGVPAGVAGTILLVARIYDSVIDPAIGAASDKYDTRWGRRRPWMAAGAVLGAASVFGLFVPLWPVGSVGAYVQLGLSLLLFYTSYSFYAIPGTAIVAEMTTDPDQRTSLMSYRTLFFQIGGLFAAAGLPWMIGALGGDKAAYAKAGVLAALFVGVSMMISVLVTSKTRRVLPSSQHLPGGKYLLTMLQNRPFMVLVGVKICVFTATSSMGAAALFFMREVLQRDERSAALLQLCSGLAGLVALPVWRWFAQRQSKATVFATALVISGLCKATWLMATPDEPDWVFIARSMISGIGSVGSVLMTLSVLPDTIDSDYEKTGLRREGMYSAMFEFLTKAAFAVGPFLVGIYLQTSGYVSSTTGAGVPQTEQAVNAVRNVMGLIPSLAYGAGLILILANRKVWAPAPARAR